MSRPIIFLPAARLEMIEAQDWYEARGKGLGARFRDEVERQLYRMIEHPQHFPAVRGDVRRAQVKHFPYGVFFREQRTRIVVLACFHLSRDPMIWRSRL